MSGEVGNLLNASEMIDRSRLRAGCVSPGYPARSESQRWEGFGSFKTMEAAVLWETFSKVEMMFPSHDNLLFTKL